MIKLLFSINGVPVAELQKQCTFLRRVLTLLLKTLWIHWTIGKCCCFDLLCFPTVSVTLCCSQSAPNPLGLNSKHLKQQWQTTCRRKKKIFLYFFLKENFCAFSLWFNQLQLGSNLLLYFINTSVAVQAARLKQNNFCVFSLWFSQLQLGYNFLLYF